MNPPEGRICVDYFQVPRVLGPRVPTDLHEGDMDSKLIVGVTVSVNDCLFRVYPTARLREAGIGHHPSVGLDCSYSQNSSNQEENKISHHPKLNIEKQRDQLDDKKKLFHPCTIVGAVLTLTHKHKTSKSWKNDFKYVRWVKSESSKGAN